MVLQDGYCEKCGKQFTNIYYKWCKPCLINDLKLKNFTSGNGEIDDLIQEMQLKIDKPWDRIVFEWIPYNQFNDVKEIGKDDVATIYSAIWKDGPLDYDKSKDEYTRRNFTNYRVVLKCFHESQNITDEILNEV